MIMKRYILAILAVFLACSYTNAQISFYGEWYRKGSGKLDSKMWHTPTASRSEYYGDADGAGTVMIFKFDEMKAYIIDDAKKTIMIIDDVNKLSTNRVVGMDIEVSHSSSKEFKGIEDIEGKECEHYLIKSEATQMMNAFKEKLDNSKSSGKSQEEQLKGLMELLGTQKKN